VGYGDESPEVFAPTEFDADQIVATAAAGGMAGLILTCKHHDGFCSGLLDHRTFGEEQSLARGRGDVVREISEACRRHNLKFGVYLSPWDRNHSAYGHPEYIQYYRNQLRELLTGYGPLFEVWFDGANGGDGSMAAPAGTGPSTGTPTTIGRIPGNLSGISSPRRVCSAMPAGRPVVGNENGIAGDPCWHCLDSDRFVPGEADTQELNRGRRHGKHWLPAECDVSIRPGWFYHAAEDDRVRTPENLLELYFQSVGRGASLHLNLPPDRRGRFANAMQRHCVASMNAGAGCFAWIWRAQPASRWITQGRTSGIQSEQYDRWQA